MNYEFPVITDIEQVREAIAGRDEFIEAEREGFIVFNYLVNFGEETFPRANTKDPKLNELYLILRECRGFVFGLDGKPLSRRYHKFFNVDERPEVMAAKIDITQPHIRLEKLDGSMITPLLLDLKIKWATKMGLTDIGQQAGDWVANNPHYEEYARGMVASGYTPIFEWCSRQNRIVIDHPVDRLVLTAIRETITGKYMSYDLMKLAESFNIEVVQQIPGTVDSMKAFLEETRAVEDAEGQVIRFDSGHMLKGKGEQYCNLHRTKEALGQEKNVWALVLDDLQDDFKPTMDPEDAERLDKFARLLHEGIAEKAEELKWIVIAAKDNIGESKKKFALKIVAEHPVENERPLLYKIWDGGDALEVVHNRIRANMGSKTKLESVRGLAGGVKWGYELDEAPD